MSQPHQTNQSHQAWQQKCLKLQNQLLQARIQQINLKRINRSLEDTLKLAMTEDLPQTQRNSTHRINLTWKQKYEQELQKNLQNQNYIKLLQTKPNTPSATKTHKKRQYSTNTRVSLKTQTHTRYAPTPLTTMPLFDNVNPKLQTRKSVKKMEGFMERLMKEKYSISDFGLGDYVQNYEIEAGSRMGNGRENRRKDPIEKLFGEVKGIKGKENYHCGTEEEELPLKVRGSVNQNRMTSNRSVSSKVVEHTIVKKLVMPSHFR